MKKSKLLFVLLSFILMSATVHAQKRAMRGVDESALPVTMEVDYIRVFQKK